jgi:quercetin dioxygenase-like cupin family protein
MIFRLPKEGSFMMATQPVPKATSPDPIQVDPQHYSIEMEDEKVRVLRIRYGPHEKSKMHSHPRLVCVMMTDGHIRFTYPDGNTEEVTVKAGQVLSFPAVDHLPENLGDQPFEVVAVELKG